MPRFSTFCGPTYVMPSNRQAADRCVNLYPSVAQGSSSSPVSLVGRPGLALFATVGSGPIRGLWAGNDRVFCVSGQNLYEVLADGTATNLGNVGDDVNHSPAQIISSAPTYPAPSNHLVVISAGLVYDHDGATLEQQFFDDDPLNAVRADYGCYMDGYFIVHVPGSNRFYISGLLDGRSWSTLDYGEKLSSTDQVIAVTALNNQLWLWGRRTIEPWYNSGNAKFPFEPIKGAMINVGCDDPWWIVQVNNTHYFCGTTDAGGTAFYRTQGSTLQRISTDSIDYLVGGPRGSWSNSYRVAWAYEEAGHVFVLFNELGNQYTFAFDVSTGLWHEWQASTGDAMDLRSYCAPTAGFGGHLVGSSTDGRIYYQSLQFYDDAGIAITRKRVVADNEYGDERDRVFYHQFEIAMQVPGWLSGTANLQWATFDYSSVPQYGATLSIPLPVSSDDMRFVWNRLGKSRAPRIWRFTIDGTGGPVVINDAFVRLSRGKA